MRALPVYLILPAERQGTNENNKEKANKNRLLFISTRHNLYFFHFYRRNISLATYNI